MDFLEFPDISKEEKGGLVPGRLKLTNQAFIFKNNKTGKVNQIQASELDSIRWHRLAATHGLRIMLKSGTLYRFGGFVETDHDKLAEFFQTNFEQELKSKEFCLKGWNWGTAKFMGDVLSFDVDKNTAFEVPLGNVSHCTSAKSEVTLEFHQNDESAVSLMELRFHIPTDPNSSIDPVQAFLDNVLAKASIIQATGNAFVTFKELHCLTPRGRYDIKMFPTFVQLHGKTFDYKIPLDTILRVFLLPHKDNRQMFFVLNLKTPIKQGQTRYQFLILLFNKEEETTVEIALSEEEIKKKYKDKLQKEMSGPTFEVISRVMKAIVDCKITVPGSFKGHSGTPAITCSFRAGNGLLYPLERGLIYVHKPPVHIRFDDIASVNFARSGGSTRSFDFEIETRDGLVHTFSSIEKDEYGKLFDFATSKKLRIKNRDSGLTGKEKPVYNEDELVDSDVEDEPDAYLQRVKAEGQDRDAGGGSTDEESSDESFAPEESGSEVAEEYDSNPPTSSDSDDEEGSDSRSGGDTAAEKKKPEKEKKPKPPKKSKSAKTVKEPGMRKKRQKKERDENKPKRPPSAYFLYLADVREKIKKDNPGISITEITKKAGEMWKEVSDKTKWEEKAGVLKKEYEKAMAEYKASGASESKSSKEATPKKDKDKKVSTASSKSPTKSPGSFKSKEYVSSSSDSSDSEDKPLKKKKGSDDSDDEKMEIDEGSASGSD